MISTERMITIQNIVENYYSGVKIVGKTDISLFAYLTRIRLKDNEIIFALEYNETRPREVIICVKPNTQ